MTPCTLHNQSTGTIVAERLACAHTSFTRMRGLLGRSGIAAGEGLWIKPSSGIHTLGMRFPIDVLALDGELRVIVMWHALAPWRVPMPRLRIRSVVELAAGEILRRGVEAGHRLRVHAAHSPPG